MSLSITYRQASREDYPAILELYNAMYSSNRSLEDFLWLVKHNPAGEAVIFLALQNDEVVGVQSLIPYAFIQNGQRVFTYKSEDSLVRGDLRGKGIYATLYKMVHQFTSHTLVWGLTDKQKILEKVGMPSSQRLLIAVSVKRPGFVSEYQGLLRFVTKSIFYSWVFFKTLLCKRTITSKLELNELNQKAYGKVDQFFQTLSIANPEIYFPVMDAPYLQWRLNQNPNLETYKVYCTYDAAGKICLLSIIGFKGKSAYWLSFYALPSVSIIDQRAHVQKLRRKIFTDGFTIIHTWLFENNSAVERVKSLFLEAGFVGVRKGLWIVNNSHRVGIDVHRFYFTPQLGIR